MPVPDKLRNSMKGLINIKSNGNKFFPWCHIKHLNPLKIYPERIAKADRKMVLDLDYVDIKFPASKKSYIRIEKKNCINVFCLESDLVYFTHVSDKKFENCMDLLLITDENKSYYVFIKDFNRFMCNKTKNEIKNTFADISYNASIVKKSCKNIKHFV